MTADGAMAIGRVRVLHVATVAMSTVFLRGQAGFMKRKGFDVHVLTSPGDELEGFAREEGVTTHTASMARRISPLADVGAVRDIRRVIRATAPTVVHAHTPKGGLLGLTAAASAGVPVRIYQMRGLPFVTATGSRRALLRTSERVSCSLAHRVLANSRSMAGTAIEEGICPPAKLDVLCGGSGNGVDANGKFDPGRYGSTVRGETRDRLEIPRDARVLGFVGRLVRDKGVVELAEAWAELRVDYPDLHLVLVGPLEERDRIPRSTEASLRSDPRVHLTGLDWETPPLYAAMDIVALPTYREGFPNVPLEAAAMELPVVATRVPGCMDAVVAGETGLLARARDSAALAGAIRAYLDDAGLRARHGRAGRARVVRDFRQEALWEALYAEYCRLLDEGGLTTPDETGAAA